MFSLIFETVEGNQLMLPIAMTAFMEKKTPDDRPFLVAYFNGQEFKLKGTLAGISYEIQRAMNPPINFK